MATKAYASGNYFYLEVEGTTEPLMDSKSAVRVWKSNDVTDLYVIKSPEIGRHEVLLSDLTDDLDVAYTLATWKTFYEGSTGFNPAAGGSVALANATEDGLTPKTGGAGNFTRSPVVKQDGTGYELKAGYPTFSMLPPASHNPIDPYPTQDLNYLFTNRVLYTVYFVNIVNNGPFSDVTFINSGGGLSTLIGGTLTTGLSSYVATAGELLMISVDAFGVVNIRVM